MKKVDPNYSKTGTKNVSRRDSFNKFGMNQGLIRGQTQSSAGKRMSKRGNIFP